MKSMIHIGADAESVKKTLPDITKALLQILSSGAGDEVKKKAIEALSLTFQVQNISINGCNLNANEKKK